MCSCSLQKMLKSFYAFDSLERPHSYIHTGQAPQYLSNCISTISSSGNRYRLRSCDTADYILPRTRTKFGERVSTTPVRPPGTLCHLTYMTLLTLTYSRNDLKLFCLIVRTDLLLLLYGTPRFHLRGRHMSRHSRPILQRIGMQSLVRYGADVTLLSTVAT